MKKFTVILILLIVALQSNAVFSAIMVDYHATAQKDATISTNKDTIVTIILCGYKSEDILTVMDSATQNKNFVSPYTFAYKDTVFVNVEYKSGAVKVNGVEITGTSGIIMFSNDNNPILSLKKESPKASIETIVLPTTSSPSATTSTVSTTPTTTTTSPIAITTVAPKATNWFVRYKPTGYAFQDAKALLKCDSVSQLATILAAYIDVRKAEATSNLGMMNLLKALDNKFLSSASFTDDVVYHLAEKTTAAGGGTELLANITSTVKSVGELDVTTLADGFAKFVVKRTKQELSISFFEQFKNELDSLEGLSLVFPQTYRTLSAIGPQLYLYDLYLQTLRESFKSDLKGLTHNLPAVLETSYFAGKPLLKDQINMACYVALELQNKTNPGVIIENFPVKYLNSTYPQIKVGFQTLQLISASLRSNNDTSYWITPNEFLELKTNKQLLNLYCGLLIEKAKAISFNANGTETTLGSKLNSLNNTAAEIADFVAGMAIQVKSLESKIEKVKQSESDSVKIENYCSVISGTVDLMRYGVQIEKLNISLLDSLDLTRKTKRYFDQIQLATDIVSAINRRQYTTAIVNASQMISPVSQLLPNDKQKLLADANYVLSKAKVGAVDMASAQLILKNLQNELSTAAQNQLGDVASIAKKIQQYGTFMASIASANNSDEAAAVIEQFALPVGSARIKKESAINVAINAYCGLYAGTERIKGLDTFNDINFTHWNSFGVTAPIGISISKGHYLFPFSTVKFSGSSSIFLSVIDLGALASFRFTSANDSVSSAPKVQLKDILSPGIFYSIGLPKVPVSVNIGYQFGPILREVTATGNNFANAKYTRFSVSVCVDLPLLNLYNKPR